VLEHLGRLAKTCKIAKGSIISVTWSKSIWLGMWITWGKGKDERFKPHSSLGEKEAYKLLESLILVLCNNN
jgi:hypothetical protein